jgi:hypothetical protein
MLNAFFPILVALGIGLLIGIERERLKGEDSNRRFAGIRTFAISSLMGCISIMTGSNLLFGLAVSVISLFCMVGYLANRDQDPGLTTEISLVLTCFLGGMTVISMPIAAGSGVAVAFLLKSNPFCFAQRRKEGLGSTRQLENTQRHPEIVSQS